MSDSEVILSEKCGTLGRLILYIKKNDQNTIARLGSTDSFSKSVLNRSQDFFREVFLPHGYPDSVSEDYFEYQIWDTVQAFCSTITGTFTTQAILKGVGVGNAEATPFAAAITWIMKDGTGMIGRIFFAWWKGNSLDADCKKWRLFADILNDGAMFLELLVPFFTNFTLQVLCITTAMKAVVGVAGGATRAAITQHQAIKGNMADVSAKDGSQETFVNLIASIVGIVLLAVFRDGYYEWFLFAIFTAVHLMANYFAVCSLTIPYLNNSRLTLVLYTYLRYDTVTNPQSVNKKESVVVGFGPKVKALCGFNIKIGQQLKELPHIVKAQELSDLVQLYKNHKYLLVPHIEKRVIYVVLEKGESSEDVITAYFHAVLLGITLCHYNNIPLKLHAKRQLHHATPIIRLYTMMKSSPKNESGQEKNLPHQMLANFNYFVAQEVVMFFTALNVNDWNTESHAIETGEWRANWKNEFGNDVLNVLKKDQ